MRGIPLGKVYSIFLDKKEEWRKSAIPLLSIFSLNYCFAAFFAGTFFTTSFQLS